MHFEAYRGPHTTHPPIHKNSGTDSSIMGCHPPELDEARERLQLLRFDINHCCNGFGR